MAEYSSYWLREKVVSLDWEKPFFGPLYAWFSAIQGKSGPMKIPAMLRVLFTWLADRLEGGDRLQRPLRPVRKDCCVPAENGRAWIGGFLQIVPGCQGPWFSLEVDRTWGS